MLIALRLFFKNCSFFLGNTSSTKHFPMVARVFYCHLLFFNTSCNDPYFKHIKIFQDQVEIEITFLFSKYFNTSILARLAILDVLGVLNTPLTRALNG